MEISEVRVRLVEDANDRLKAVCTVTLDDEFVVRDVKIVEGSNGLFVAMPSRKLTTGCPRCRSQNHLRARHCNECGTKLPEARIPSDENGREKAHRDIAHPITAAFRQSLQDQVLEAYRIEAESAGDEDSAEDVRSEDAKRSRHERKPRRETTRDAEDELDDSDETGLEEDAEDEFEDDEDESDEADDEKDGKRILSDYDALIAELKGGPKKDGRNGSDRGEHRGGRRSEEGSRRDGGGGRGGRGRGGRRGERGEGTSKEKVRERPPAERTERPVTPAPVATPTPVVTPAPVATPAPAAKKVERTPPPQPVKHFDNDENGFGAGLFNSVTEATVSEPARPAVEPEPPAVEPEPEPIAEVKNDPPTFEDDDGFGAGIL